MFVPLELNGALGEMLGKEWILIAFFEQFLFGLLEMAKKTTLTRFITVFTTLINHKCARYDLLPDVNITRAGKNCASDFK